MGEQVERERIGRYHVERLLGKGAMGAVYLARDPLIERDVALKTIRLDSPGFQGKIDESRERFLREAKLTGRLQHPNIVVVYEFGEDAGMLFLAMEYVGGGSLSQRMERTEPFTIGDKLIVSAQIADALAHAHERGVLHRDIKPANILMTPEGAAKVSDFGIGKLTTGDVNLTSTGQMIGSPAYMSPEHVRGEKLDSRTDIFSLGVVMYQLFTGLKPFPAESLTTLVYQILNRDPEDPKLVNGALPAEISPVILKCLAKNREERYTDAGEIAEILRDLLAQSEDAFNSTLSKRNRSARSGSMRALGSTAETPAQATTPMEGTRPVPESEVERTQKQTDAGGPRSEATGPPAPVPEATKNPVPDPPPEQRDPVERERQTAPEGASASTGAPTPGMEAPKSSASAVAGSPFLAAARVPKDVPATPARSKPSFWGLLAVVGIAGLAAAIFMSRNRGAETAPTQTASPSPVPAAPPAGEDPGAGLATTGVVPPEASTAAEASETPAAGAETQATAPARGKGKFAKAEPGPPTPAPTAVQIALPEPTPTPEPDLKISARLGLRLKIQPDQARVFLDGTYIGIADDWDNRGGGELLLFVLPEARRFTVRIALPGFSDLNLDVTIDPKAPVEIADIKREMVSGTPAGPTGPEGKVRGIDYSTTGKVRFEVKPKEAVVLVDGQSIGTAAEWQERDFGLTGPAVHEVILLSGEKKKKSFRVIVSPSTGSALATIKAKL